MGMQPLKVTGVDGLVFFPEDVTPADMAAGLGAALWASRPTRPCPHGPFTVGFDDVTRCGWCGDEVPDPRGCRHLRIDNTTAQCVECGEKMIRGHTKTISVRDAPNLAACTRPDCGGPDDPECENPAGLYVPDTTREREVPIECEVTYDCERCRNGQDITFSPNDTAVWPCGGNHRGDTIPLDVGALQP